MVIPQQPHSVAATLWQHENDGFCIVTTLPQPSVLQRLENNPQTHLQRKNPPYLAFKFWPLGNEPFKCSCVVCIDVRQVGLTPQDILEKKNYSWFFGLSNTETSPAKEQQLLFLQPFLPVRHNWWIKDTHSIQVICSSILKIFR